MGAAQLELRVTKLLAAHFADAVNLATLLRPKPASDVDGRQRSPFGADRGVPALLSPRRCTGDEVFRRIQVVSAKSGAGGTKLGLLGGLSRQSMVRVGRSWWS